MGMPDDASIEDWDIRADVISYKKFRPHISSCPIPMIICAAEKNPAVCAHRIQIID
jgi:hypothetical protein